MFSKKVRANLIRSDVMPDPSQMMKPAKLFFKMTGKIKKELVLEVGRFFKTSSVFV
ncbi:hypothetical protein HMPREF9104_02972 [Lentilactobacillus kisonensis F0435]|uniref:Uncharacterized protein n=1 Tax=Lentilactobacillus kisonensis F0435 TaxID=797516 RepID=H1LK26_9LACO|nr:hypothetical protein HMPREF9104_02972 [Lentilactobacillus kisonensis F0435]